MANHSSQYKKSEHNDSKPQSILNNKGRHTVGNVTGLTYIDFIAIPARARLALVYAL